MACAVALKHETGARAVLDAQPFDQVERRLAALQVRSDLLAPLGVFTVDVYLGCALVLFGLYVAGVVSAGAIYRKSSYLVGRLETQVASPLITIVDDPLLPRAPGSRPFDIEPPPNTPGSVVVGAARHRAQCSITPDPLRCVPVEHQTHQSLGSAERIAEEPG